MLPEVRGREGCRWAGLEGCSQGGGFPWGKAVSGLLGRPVVEAEVGEVRWEQTTEPPPAPPSGCGPWGTTLLF